jgi:hypothetical protein
MHDYLQTIYDLTGLARIQSAWMAPVVASIYVALTSFLVAAARVRISRMQNLPKIARGLAYLALGAVLAAVAMPLFPLSMTQGVNEGLATNWLFLAYVIVLFGSACLVPVLYLLLREEGLRATMRPNRAFESGRAKERHAAQRER